MCDSLVMPSALRRSSSPKFSQSGTSYCASEVRLDVLDELRCGNASIEVSNNSEETEKDVPCVQRSDASLCRFQLEKDVQQLESQLMEEMELRASLENVLERNAIKLSSPEHLPHHVQVLISNIVLLETTVSKLEHEIVSLHFQLSQERNERRLMEYRLRHLSSQSISLCSSDTMSTLVQLSSI